MKLATFIFLLTLVYGSTKAFGAEESLGCLQCGCVTQGPIKPSKPTPNILPITVMAETEATRLAVKGVANTVAALPVVAGTIVTAAEAMGAIKTEATLPKVGTMVTTAKVIGAAKTLVMRPEEVGATLTAAEAMGTGTTVTAAEAKSVTIRTMTPMVSAGAC